MIVLVGMINNLCVENGMTAMLILLLRLAVKGRLQKQQSMPDKLGTGGLFMCLLRRYT